jgi:3-dehydroquinate dehydratase/shikimate dehydrogenase
MACLFRSATEVSAMLCVSLMPETTDEARRGMAEAARMDAWAEVRLDAMREPDLARLLDHPPCPVIITYRPRREGGLYDGPEGPRLETLRQAAKLGATYIDIEHDAIAALGDVPRSKLIVSSHNFERMPDDLPALHARLARSGAAVVKIAVMANDILDTAAVLRLLKNVRTPTIALAMGPRGVLTRILAPKFGGFLTYASLGGTQNDTVIPSECSESRNFAGVEAGPGQVTAAEMRDLYHIDRIGPATRVYGVIANPVGHSLSPRIHNAAFAALGLDAVYLPLWVEGDPAAFVRAMREFDFDGYSVTIPHKQAVMAALDEVEPVARLIGAVNTIQRRPDAALFGTNTDWSSGLAAIEAVVGPGGLLGRKALIVGAGGVGRAMAFGLIRSGVSVMITDVDASRAAAMAAGIGAPACGLGEMAEIDCDLVLNCTPIGMHPKTDASPVPAKMLRPGRVVYDAVYNPIETRLIREARAAGCLTVAGIDHFVGQAIEQFQLWTGRKAPAEIMRRVVVEALSNKS